MIYGVLGIVGLGMALSVNAYERFPVRAEGVRVDATGQGVLRFLHSERSMICPSR